MADLNLTVKEEAYCQAIAKYGRKAKVQAYTEAGYSTNMSPAAIGISADKLYNKPKLSLRIDELTLIAEEVAEKEFGISVKWRLEALKAIHDAGISKYKDSNLEERYENLAASNSAIKTMNEMLGTSEGDEDDTGKELSINFTVSQPISDVKITMGEGGKDEA